MEANILILDSYEGFKQNALQACTELNCRPQIIHAYQGDLDLIKRIKAIYPENVDPDAIVTRGSISSFLADYFPNSVISLANPDDIDFLYALKAATAYGDKVGIIVHKKHEIDSKLPSYQFLLGLSYLKSYSYEQAHDISSILLNAKNDGVNVTVGGGTTAHSLSKSIDIPNVFVPTGVLSIKRAINNALLYAKYKNEQRKKNQYETIAMNYIESGLLIVENDIIKFANDVINSILNVGTGHIIGQSYRELLSKLNILFTEKSFKNITEKIVTIKDQSYLYKEVLSQDNNSQICTFQDINILRKEEHAVRNILYNHGYSTKYCFDDLISISENMQLAIEKGKVFALTDAPILITGPTGSGKELICQSIHSNGQRADYPFVPINCAAIPRELMESELFGYEDGAFTSAKKGGKIGLLEIAHKGTVFFDEINSMPLELQGKLLRAIEEKEFRRIGSSKTIKVDVRLISSSNEDLLSLSRNKAFRNDLYHRISTLTINIAPLNERKDDILPLAKRLLEIYCKRYNIEIDNFTEDEQKGLLNYYYDGNVRELENIIQRFVIQYPFQPRAKLLSLCLNNQGKAKPPFDDENTITINKGSLDNMEIAIINAYLEQNNNNKNTVADLLNISRSTLWRKLATEKDNSSK